VNFDLFTYPTSPGWKRTDTSREAAQTVNAATLRARVLRVLIDGPLTADECAEALRCPILSIRPRLSELRLQGKVEDTGERRRNDSGKRAIVWRRR
jgi:predicted Rossmann fold nucleotide-binding protein DprA/Smf involved in DNA uptake